MQTVQAQIRLLLKEQSDQGLHCLPFHRVLERRNGPVVRVARLWFRKSLLGVSSRLGFTMGRL